MKTLFALPALTLVGLGASLFVVVRNNGPVHARGRSPEAQRRFLAQNARVEQAYAAFQRGDPSREAEARAVMAGLRPEDPQRPEFATLLVRRGEVRAAYGLVGPYVHANEFSLPDDRALALYAGLADRLGHPAEAAWARGRMGEDGHFQVWKKGEEYMFASGRAAYVPAGEYGPSVNRDMDYGLRLHPAHRAAIEALRRELLAAP